MFSANRNPSRNVDIAYEKARVEEPGTPGSPQNRNFLKKIRKLLEMSWNFMNFHQPLWNLTKIMFCVARERIGALQPLKKYRNYLSFCMPALYGGILVNSMKFIENEETQWKCWNFMKIIKFHEIPWFSGFRVPSRNPLFSLLKIKVWAAWTVKNIKTQ